MLTVPPPPCLLPGELHLVPFAHRSRTMLLLCMSRRRHVIPPGPSSAASKPATPIPGIGIRIDSHHNSPAFSKRFCVASRVLSVVACPSSSCSGSTIRSTKLSRYDGSSAATSARASIIRRLSSFRAPGSCSKSRSIVRAVGSKSQRNSRNLSWSRYRLVVELSLSLSYDTACPKPREHPLSLGSGRLGDYQTTDVFVESMSGTVFCENSFSSRSSDSR